MVLHQTRCHRYHWPHTCMTKTLLLSTDLKSFSWMSKQRKVPPSTSTHLSDYWYEMPKSTTDVPALPRQTYWAHEEGDWVYICRQWIPSVWVSAPTKDGHPNADASLQAKTHSLGSTEGPKTVQSLDPRGIKIIARHSGELVTASSSDHGQAVQGQIFTCNQAPQLVEWHLLKFSKVPHFSQAADILGVSGHLKTWPFICTSQVCHNAPLVWCTQLSCKLLGQGLTD